MILFFFCIVLVMIPTFIKNTYFLGLFIIIFINCLLSLSSNFITGMGGILSIGQAMFFGIGAYTSAILAVNYNLDFVFTILIACIVSLVSGLLIGVTALRVRDKYLAMVTLGSAEIIRMIALNWESVTRGAKGITRIPGIVIFSHNYFSYNYKYYAALIVLLIVLISISYIMRSNYGKSLLCVRDDEMAASSVGINAAFIKQIAFGISAAVAGCGGALYAHYMNFIDTNIFGFNQSIFMMSMAILGGLGSIPGSLLGAIILTILPELLRFSTDYRLIVYGIVIVVIVIFRPSGILGNVNIKKIFETYSSEKVHNE